MNFLQSRREASERLLRHAAAHGVDLASFRDEYDVFSHRKRWIDFWMEGDKVGYHLRGEIAKLPNPMAASQSSFRGVWDEAGLVDDFHQALELLQAWLIDGREIEDLTNRFIHRSML